MKNILLLNKIAKVGTDKLDAVKYEIGTDVKDPEGILVRSAVMHDMEMPQSLLAIARAGAGVNNIPIDKCSEAGIVDFNTRGANANGVKELAVCALLLASRKIVDGIAFANSLAGTTGVAKAVEAGKSQFAGTEVLGKKLGVIGLGAIGGMVANTALALGMTVTGCDPFLSVDAAWNIDRQVNKCATFEEVFADCDYLTLHVPATEKTKNMINKDTLAQMKDGVKIINLARADLVNAADMKAALESGKVSAYVTDFPTDETAGMKGAVTIPHLGASTEESEDNCAVMAALELSDYLENGNIKNSVNFPNAAMPRSGDKRIAVLHANVPAIISKITAMVSGHGANIENMVNQSKGQNAYTLIDITGDFSAESAAALEAEEGIYKVRVL